VRGAGVVHGGARQLQEHRKKYSLSRRWCTLPTFLRRALAAQLARRAAGHGAATAAPRFGAKRRTCTWPWAWWNNDCAWMQFYLQSSIVEKGIRVKDYATSRLDVVVGSLFTDIVAWFIIVACAATLYVHGMGAIQWASDAAEAMRPLAGDYAFVLFAFGLFTRVAVRRIDFAAFHGIHGVRGMGFESGVDKNFKEAPLFYWLYTLLIAGGAIDRAGAAGFEADQLRDLSPGTERRAVAGGDYPDAAAHQPHRSDGRTQKLAAHGIGLRGNVRDCDRETGMMLWGMLPGH